MNKRLISFMLAAFMLFMFSGCNTSASEKSKIENTKIDIGESELFTEEDRKSAADWILNKWSKENTITELYSITYAGDEKSKYEQQYYADVEGYSHEEIIVFHVAFHTKKGSASEGFDGDMDYEEWAQILGRDNGGNWVFVTGGYA